MWQMFVLGPIATRAGLVRQCLDCRGETGVAGACHGFGPGCLAPTPRAVDPDQTARRAPAYDPPIRR